MKKFLSLALAVIVALSGMTAAYAQDDDKYIYDVFSDSSSGWQEGAVADDAYKANMTVSDGNLIMSGNASNTTNGYAPNIYRLINSEDGIPAEVGKNVVVKTRFKVTESNTRTYIKLNRPLAVENLSANTTGHNLYTLLVYNKGTVSVGIGDTTGTNGATLANTADICKNVTAGTWVDVKIVLKSNESGTVYEKADYYITVNGTTYTQLDKVIPTAGRTDGLSDLTALRSITFTARENTNTTTIDYFKVYEESYAAAELSRNAIKSTDDDQSFAIRFNKDVPISGTADNLALKDVNGNVVSVSKTWDSENKVLTINSDNALENGVYTIDILGFTFMDEPITLSENVVTIYEPEEVIYDNFSNDAGGWQEGAVVDNAYKASMTASDGNLVMSGNAANTTNGYAPNVYRLINNGRGIDAEEGKNVVVKTRFKVTESNTRTYIKLNRPLAVENLSPSTTGWNLYTLLVYNKGNISIGNGNGGTGSAQASTVDVCKNITAGTWVDVKIVLKSNASGTVYEKADYYITVNGTTYTQLDKVIPTAGRTDGWSDLTALRSIAFTARENTNTTTIDYFKVYEENYAKAKLSRNAIKSSDADQSFTISFNKNVQISGTADDLVLKDSNGNAVSVSKTWDSENNVLTINSDNTLDNGVYTIDISGFTFIDEPIKLSENVVTIYEPEEVIYDNFSNDVGGWQEGAVVNDTYKASMTASDGNLVMSGNATNTTNGYAPNVYRLINNGRGIEAEAEKNVVVKTRFKVTESNTRTYIKLNRPLDVENLSTNTTGYNLYTLLVYNKGTVSVGTGDTTGTNGVTLANIAEICKNVTAGTWVDAKIVLKPNESGTVYEKADYYVTVNGTTYTQTDKVIPTAGRIDGWSDLTALRSIAFTARENTNTTTIDYFKVYEENLDEVEKTSLLTTVVDENSDNQQIKIKTHDSAVVSDLKVIKLLKGEEEIIINAEQNSNIITITPENPLESGKYTIDVSNVVLSDFGIGIDIDKTEITVTSIETDFNDQFTDNFGDWYAGMAPKGFEVQDYKAENGIMKFTVPATGTTYTDSYSPNVTRVFNNGVGIPFETGRKIVIRARVKKNDIGSRLLLKFNRPDKIYEDNKEQAYNYYTLLSIGNGSEEGTEWIRYPETPEAGQVFLSGSLFEGASIAGKWIDIEIVLSGDGDELYADYSVTVDGVNKTGHTLIEDPGLIEYDNSALKSLTFTTRGVADTMEIAYVSVDTYEDGEKSINLTKIEGDNGNEDTYSADVCYRNDSDELKTIFVALAGYEENEDGSLRLIHVTCDTKSLTSGEDYRSRIGETSSEQSRIIKAFVWEKDTNIPLMSSTNVVINKN